MEMDTWDLLKFSTCSGVNIFNPDMQKIGTKILNLALIISKEFFDRE